MGTLLQGVSSENECLNRCAINHKYHILVSFSHDDNSGVLSQNHCILHLYNVHMALNQTFSKRTRTHFSKWTPFQFVCRQNISAEDVIVTAPHAALSYLDNSSQHVRMLFIDLSSAFNTIIRSKLITGVHPEQLNNRLTTIECSRMHLHRQACYPNRVTGSLIPWPSSRRDSRNWIARVAYCIIPYH